MIKKKLQNWLINSGCSRNELATLLKVSPRTVDGWLAHKSRPISAKMQKAIEELIAPKLINKTLSKSEKEFFDLSLKIDRENWLQQKIEQILVLSHRAMTYWDTNYQACSDDSEFYEELTDITQSIRDISSDITALGAHHADCVMFKDFDEYGNIIKYNK